MLLFKWDLDPFISDSVEIIKEHFRDWSMEKAKKGLLT